MRGPLRFWKDRLGIGVVAVFAALTAWSASWSWAPLYAAPHRYLWPGLVCAVLVSGVGLASRAQRLAPYLTVVLQAVVGIAYLVGQFATRHGDLARLPTPSAISGFTHQLTTGAGQINRYSSPVPARFAEVAPFLAVCTLALLIAVDLFAGGLRRVPLAGLPLLLALTVPISVLTAGLSPIVFIATGASFLLLLAAEHTTGQRSWGRQAPVHSDGPRHAATVWLAATPIGVAALAGALVIPLALPIGQGVFTGGPHGGGHAGTKGLTLVNPLIEIRRDLLQHTHTPMVEIRTDDPDPSYVRLNVLDQFTGTEWRSSNRNLPASNRADGPMPLAPGVSPIGVPHSNWQFRLANTFQTTWLPTPYPVASITVPGDWRYDSRTLDIVNTGPAEASQGLNYRLQALDPAYDAETLNQAGAPVGEAVAGMLDLPRGLPAVISRVARRVVRGATTEYQEAIRLQDWFRSTGGFRYSTQPAPGSGMQLLAAFVTKDKVGYCEQFAAAMAVMGRTLGIPARVVVGFLRPTGHAPAGDELFTSDDLHAWPEFYFAGSGWVHFEPTPGTRTGTAPAYTTEPLTPTRPQQSTPTSRPTPQSRSHHAPVLSTAAAAPRGGSSTGWIWLTVLLILLLVAVTPRLLRSRQRHRRIGPSAAGDGAARLVQGAWAELRATAVDHQLSWGDGRSPRQALAQLRAKVTSDPELVADLAWFGDVVERARYARSLTLGVEDTERVRSVVARWSAAIAEQVSEGSARRARWLPASLLGRPVGAVGAVTTEDDDVPVPV